MRQQPLKWFAANLSSDMQQTSQVVCCICFEWPYRLLWRG
nr:MAG TPA: hypothetical protein [Caudoviricetes sp.]